MSSSATWRELWTSLFEGIIARLFSAWPKCDTDDTYTPVIVASCSFPFLCEVLTDVLKVLYNGGENTFDNLN
jgi:hypothetical protein